MARIEKKRLARLNDDEFYSFTAADLAELLGLSDHCRHGLTSVEVCGNCALEALAVALGELRDCRKKAAK